MILVDTSAWIEFFRGREPTATEVASLIDGNEAAWCGPVITELRRGLHSERERRLVLPLLDGCSHLTQPQGLWEEAGDLGHLLARKGVTVKTMDLLVAIWALAHDVPVLTTDRDFRAMQRAGVPLRLA